MGSYLVQDVRETEWQETGYSQYKQNISPLSLVINNIEIEISSVRYAETAAPSWERTWGISVCNVNTLKKDFVMRKVG